MKLEDVREFSNIARRFACLLAIGPELDAHCEATKADACDFKSISSHGG